MRVLILSCYLLSLPILGFGQWTPTNGPYGRELSTFQLAGTELYATANSEVFRSADSGANWVSISDGLSDFYINIKDLVVTDTFLILASNYNTGELYRTGKSQIDWQFMETGLPGHAFIRAMEVREGQVLLATAKGMYRSADAGETWVLFQQGMTDTLVYKMFTGDTRTYASTAKGPVYFLETIEEGWDVIPTDSLPENCSIYCIYSRNSTLYVGTIHGVYKTIDDGIHWSLCREGMTDTAMVDLTGDSSSLYAATYYGGVYRSPDDGEHWEPVNPGPYYLPPSLVECTLNMLYTSFTGGLFVSDDQGMTWTDCNNGLSSVSATSVLEWNGELFAGSGLGVFRSDDAGAHWIHKDSGLTQHVVWCLAGKDSLLFAGTEKGIFVSSDQGESWRSASNGVEEKRILRFGLDGNLIFTGTDKGLFRSNNNGGYWTEVIPDKCIYGFAKADEYLFASTYFGVWRSANHGNTWVEANEGLTNSWILSMGAQDSILFSGAEYVFRTDTDPVYWHPTGDGTGQAPHWPDEIVATDSTVFAGTTSCVYVSPNSGAEWFDVGEGFRSYQFMHHLRIIGEDLFAGTSLGVWKRPLEEMYSLSLSPDPLVLDFEVNSMGLLVVRTNTDWHLEGEIPGWLEIDKLIGSGTDTLLVRAVEQNPDTMNRIASFTLTSSQVEPQAFTVIQTRFEGSLLSQPDTIRLSYLSDSRDTLFIDANLSWWLAGDFPEWLSTDHSSGSGNDSVVFRTTQQNTQEFTRSASFDLESDFTPPSGIVVVQQGKPAGLPVFTISKLSVFPNPTTGRLVIRSGDSINEIRVYDCSGRMNDRFTGSGEPELTIHLKHPGVNYLEVVTEHSSSLVKVIVY